MKTDRLICIKGSLLSKIDEELNKEKSDPDIFEELMEQLLIKEYCLDKIDREVEDGTKTWKMKLEYKDSPSSIFVEIVVT